MGRVYKTLAANGPWGLSIFDFKQLTRPYTEYVVSDCSTVPEELGLLSHRDIRTATWSLAAGGTQSTQLSVFYPVPSYLLLLTVIFLVSPE